MPKLDRVLSFDDFLKNKQQGTDKKVIVNNTEQDFKSQIRYSSLDDLFASDVNKDVADNTVHPKDTVKTVNPIKPVINENVISPANQTTVSKRLTKKNLVDVLNYTFTSRTPQFDINDITWDFLDVANSRLKLINSRKDLLDPNFYTKPSDELNALTEILSRVTSDFDMDPFLQDEQFIDNTATTIEPPEEIINFQVNETDPVPMFESTLLVEDSYKVKSTFDVPANLIEEFKKKVKEDSGEDPNLTYSDAELAEQIVEYILQKYLVIDNIPTSLAVGENKSGNQEKSEADAAKAEQSDTAGSEGSINVETKFEGLTGLTDIKIEILE